LTIEDKLNLKFDYSIETLKRLKKVYDFEVLSFKNYSLKEIDENKIKINDIISKYQLFSQPFAFLHSGNVKFSLIFYTTAKFSSILHTRKNNETDLTLFNKEKINRHIDEILKKSSTKEQEIYLFYYNILKNTSLTDIEINEIMKSVKNQISKHFGRTYYLRNVLPDKKFESLHKLLYFKHQIRKYRNLIKKQPKYKKYYLFSIKTFKKKVKKYKTKYEIQKFLINFNNELYPNKLKKLFVKYSSLILGKEFTEQILQDLNNSKIEITNETYLRLLIYLKTFIEASKKYKEKFKKHNPQIKFYTPIYWITITPFYELENIENPLQFKYNILLDGITSVDDLKLIKILARALQFNLIINNFNN
jgi:hypothetical protein